MNEIIKCDLLIKDCRVLQQDMSISETMSIVITGNRITAILPTAQVETAYAPESVLSGKGKLAMPGFVDAHTHTCQQLLRGKVADEYPMVWTRFLVPFESNLRPEDVYAGARLSCLEMIKNGTTSFADSGGVHMDRVVEAAVESGMRAAIAKSTMDMGNAITGAMKETGDEAIANTIKLYDQYQGAGNGRIDIFFAIRQIMTCSEDLIRRVAAEAKARSTGIHMHLCEHRDEVSFCLQNYKMRPTAALEKMGVLGPNLLTAHNVMLSDADIDMLAANDVKIVHCPRSNLSNHGFPKTPRILNAGCSVGLASDGAASKGLDLFDEMRVLRYAMQAYWGLAAFDPVVMPCPTLLKMATQGGANAIGHGHELGTLEPGKLADIILMNIDQPHLTPSQVLLNTIVDAGSGRDITDSVIDGKLVMKDRKVLTLNEERIMHEAKEHMEIMIERAGF